LQASLIIMSAQCIVWNRNLPHFSPLWMHSFPLTFLALEFGKTMKCQLSKSFMVVIQPLSTCLIKPNLCYHTTFITKLEEHFESFPFTNEMDQFFFYFCYCKKTNCSHFFSCLPTPLISDKTTSWHDHRWCQKVIRTV